MADVSAKKRTRGIKSGTFTRKSTLALQLLENKVLDRSEQVVEEIKVAFRELEIAQDEFLAVVDEGEVAEESKYLDVPTGTMTSAEVKLGLLRMEVSAADAEELKRLANELQRGGEKYDGSLCWGGFLCRHSEGTSTVGKTRGRN